MFNYGNFMDPNALTEHKVNTLRNFIGGFYIPKRTELISDVFVQMHELDPNKTSEEVIDEDTKEKLKTSEDSTIIDKKIITELQAILEMAAKNYLKMYPLAGGREMMIHEKIKIRKYDKNVSFRSWKIDNVSNVDVATSRHLSFMVFLNNVESAGVGFLHQNIKITPEKGLILMHPSGWTFANMCESLEEPLYMITGHISFAEKLKNKPNDIIDLNQFQYETE